jgi:hypothetical protein
LKMENGGKHALLFSFPSVSASIGTKSKTPKQIWKRKSPMTNTKQIRDGCDMKMDICRNTYKYNTCAPKEKHKEVDNKKMNSS